MNSLQKLNTGRYIILALSGLSVLIFITCYAPSRLSTEFDDSYMYCRYASNFLADNGFSWNSVDGPSYGATSPVYLFLITIIKGVSRISNSSLLSLTSYFAGLVGLFLLVVIGYMNGANSARFRLPFLVIPFCLLSTSFRYHSFTGMETTLSFASNAILILSVLFYCRKPGRIAFVLLLLSAVFTTMVRPDNGLYAILFPVLFLLSAGKFNMKMAGLFLLSLGVAGGLILLLYSKLFGSTLPVPFYSKAGDFLTGYAGRENWNAAEYILLFLKDVFPFACVIALFIRKDSTKALLSIFLPVLFTFFFFSRSIQIMGWFARYYFPSIPFVVLAAFITVESYLRNGYSLAKKSVLIRATILVLVFIPVFLAPLNQKITNWWKSSIPEVELFAPDTKYLCLSAEPLEALSWWVSIQSISNIIGDLPGDITMAATEYGFIASENLDCEIIDMAGLHDITLAESGFSSGRILSRNPDLIWMPHTDYTWFRKELLDDPVFQADYEYYPELFNYGIAVRRSSDSYLEIAASLDSAFSDLYPGRVLSNYLGSPVN